jgi:hypothetical protein
MDRPVRQSKKHDSHAPTKNTSDKYIIYKNLYFLERQVQWHFYTSCPFLLADTNHLTICVGDAQVSACYMKIKQ